MYLPFMPLLKSEEVDSISSILAKSAFVNGKLTASGAAQLVKNNEQLPRESIATAQINQIIEQAIIQSPLFREALQPKQILPFLISRYHAGMEYGWHVDSPITSANGVGIRADISITIFLNDPSAYEGGELEIETDTGYQLFKMNKGEAIAYPTTKLHRVRPVTQGIRIVAVSWIQSMIRHIEQRNLAFQLSNLQQLLQQQQQGSQLHLMAQQIYSNLVRMFSEI